MTGIPEWILMVAQWVGIFAMSVGVGIMIIGIIGIVVHGVDYLRNRQGWRK